MYHSTLYVSSQCTLSRFSRSIFSSTSGPYFNINLLITSIQRSIRESSLPCFTTNLAKDSQNLLADRIKIPVTDPEANVTNYLACYSQSTAYANTLKRIDTNDIYIYKKSTDRIQIWTRSHYILQNNKGLRTYKMCWRPVYSSISIYDSDLNSISHS